MSNIDKMPFPLREPEKKETQEYQAEQEEIQKWQKVRDQRIFDFTLEGAAVTKTDLEKDAKKYQQRMAEREHRLGPVKTKKDKVYLDAFYKHCIIENLLLTGEFQAREMGALIEEEHGIPFTPENRSLYRNACLVIEDRVKTGGENLFVQMGFDLKDSVVSAEELKVDLVKYRGRLGEEASIGEKVFGQNGEYYLDALYKTAILEELLNKGTFRSEVVANRMIRSHRTFNKKVFYEACRVIEDKVKTGGRHLKRRKM